MEQRRADLVAGERALEAREHALAELERLLTERDRQLTAREQAAEQRAKTAREQKRARHDLLQERRARLAELCGETVEALRDHLAEELVASGARALRKRGRVHDEDVTRDLASLAQRVLGTVVTRYDGVGHLERISQSVVIEDAATFAALADETSSLSRTFTAEIGCTVTADSDRQSITVIADDSGARELGRRVLRALDDEPCEAETLRARITAAKAELLREVRKAGEEAFACVNLPRAAPEILDLIGRLTFRLSHSQNQWKHSIEVARLAGMLAAELGSDRIAARRGGLLHDMGKAMTHDHEGSHAVLGATVARRCGESEIVANAIGAHHDDEPMATPTAFLVTAADALSGARPGARRESATQYVARIRQIHEIASRGSLIDRVDVMYAGREVRIVVLPDAQDDALYPLAQRVARALEDEVAFPGQIRVTVIRESRVSAIAR
ncbi:MAG: HD domain-containing protein [Myxococcota bacterium]